MEPFIALLSISLEVPLWILIPFWIVIGILTLLAVIVIGLIIWLALQKDTPWMETHARYEIRPNAPSSKDPEKNKKE